MNSTAPSTAMSPLLPARVEILVVGAGPTGLAAAMSLHKHGCKDVLVVDNQLAGENSSRAIVIHAATLDALDEVDCGDALAAAGVQVTGGKLWNGHRFHRIGDFSILKGHTKYPFLLVLPQQSTERILTEKAKEQGVTIVRPVTVVDLKVNEEDPDYTDVVFADGQAVRAHYIIGADGAKSTVRTIAGISYTDPDGDIVDSDELRQAITADIAFATPPPNGRSEIMFILSNGNFFLCLPLPPAEYGGKEMWRIATGIPVGIPPPAPTTEYLQEVVDKFGPGNIPASALPNSEPLRITETVWSVRFKTDSAIAATPFTRLNSTDGKVSGGVITLVGDAGHKHPPAGGQGMNLGIRDAMFLGPVLAARAKHSPAAKTLAERIAMDGPLQKWADARHARALEVVALAKGAVRFASWRNEITWYLGCIPINMDQVRKMWMWFADVTGILRRGTAWELSGLKDRSKF